MADAGAGAGAAPELDDPTIALGASIPEVTANAATVFTTARESSCERILERTGERFLAHLVSDAMRQTLQGAVMAALASPAAAAILEPIILATLTSPPAIAALHARFAGVPTTAAATASAEAAVGTPKPVIQRFGPWDFGQ